MNNICLMLRITFQLIAFVGLQDFTSKWFQHRNTFKTLVNVFQSQPTKLNKNYAEFS